MNRHMKAESSAASATEKATLLEGKLSHLSESIEREKNRLNDELAQLKRDSKLSVSRIRTDVSMCLFKLIVYYLHCIWKHLLMTVIFNWSSSLFCSLNEWNIELMVQKKNQSYWKSSLKNLRSNLRRSVLLYIFDFCFVLLLLNYQLFVVCILSKVPDFLRLFSEWSVSIIFDIFTVYIAI